MINQLENTVSLKVEKPFLSGISRQLGNISNRLQKIENTLNRKPSIAAKLLEALADTDNWVVWGKVVDLQGEGIAGLVIRLYDRDCADRDDRLGQTLTDEEGQFYFIYKTSEFQDCFESNPDLYLKVMDYDGDTLYEWQTPIRCNAGRFERFDITLDDNCDG